MLETAAQLLLTYLLHSSGLLGAVALLDRVGLLARWGMAEAAWRAALLGAWLTAAAALALPALQPPRTPGATAPAVVAMAADAAPQSVHTPSAATVSPPPQLGNADPPGWPLAVAALTTLWLAVALLGCLRLLWQALRLTLHARRLPPWPDPELAATLHGLVPARQTPELRASTATSPWAWGRVIGLPRWTATRLDARQREAVLRHELAHLLRRDPAWRLLTRAAACAGWLQPLNRLALRRLDLLMEAACDRWAADSGDARQALAEGLMRCAEQLHRHRTPRLALAMLRHDTPPLLARMRLLLEPQTMSSSPLRHARWYLAGSLLLTAIALPAALLPPGTSLRDALPELGQRLSDWSAPMAIRLDIGGPGTTRIHARGPGGEQLLRWQGNARFSDDESEVLAVDGPLLFRERSDGLTREWQVRPVDGGLQREYRVNGVLQPVPDADARAWIAGMVRLAVESTQPPAQRALRIYQRDGWDGLQRYLQAAQGDHQRRQRLEAVLTALPQAQRPAALFEQLLAVSARIESDFERRHALQLLAESLPLDPAQWQALLQQVKAVDADFERAELLGVLAPRLPAAPDVIAAWQGALAGMDADFELRRTLENQLRLSPEPQAWLLPALQAAEAVGADFEQRQLLESAVRMLPADAAPALLVQLAAASTRIGSDFERREALLALLRRQPRDLETLQAVFTATAGMSAGYERLQLLQALAPLLPSDGSLDAAYRQLARPLGTHDRGLAEQALDR